MDHRARRHTRRHQTRTRHRNQLYRYRELLQLWHERRVHRRRPAQSGHRSRERRAGQQGSLQRRRPFRRRHQTRDQRLAQALGHRLPRPLHHPPLRLRRSHGRDHGSAQRPGARGQGSRARRQRHVCLPAAQPADRRTRPRMDALYEHAVPLQPAVPRGRAGDDSGVPPV